MMARHPANVEAGARTVRDLNELIRAIDQRIPQVHRDGETEIAMAAAVLKSAALTRIAEIERAMAGWKSGDSQPFRSK